MLRKGYTHFLVTVNMFTILMNGGRKNDERGGGGGGGKSEGGNCKGRRERDKVRERDVGKGRRWQEV